MFEYNSEKVFIKPLFSIAGLATQIVIVDKESNPPVGLLLDIGDGTCRDILDNGLDFAWINTIVISHGHYDHMGGIYSFLGTKRMLGDEHEINVYYPSKTVEVENIVKMFKENYPDSIPFNIKMHPIDPQKSAEIVLNKNFVLKAFPVLHRGSTLIPGVLPLIPACGYQVSLINHNLKLAFSGDCAPSTILYDLFSSEVDIGFIENSHPTDDWVKDNVNRFHLTKKEALEFSKNCKKTILIHSLPQHILKNTKSNL